MLTFVNLSDLQAIYKQTFTEYFQIYKVRFTETSEGYEGLSSDFRDLHDLHTQIYRKFTDLQTISKMRFTSIFSRDLQKSPLCQTAIFLHHVVPAFNKIWGFFFRRWK